jgi:hypothetical protein
MKQKTVVISVRISRGDKDWLEAEGTKDGLSAAGVLKRLLNEARFDMRYKQLWSELIEVHQDVSKVKSNQRLLGVAILADGGKASREEAEEFVETRLAR